jgi:hypothetical protein
MGTMRRLMAGVICAALAGLCGCSEARLVSCAPTGGVVAIPNNSNTWPCYHHKHAEELIREQCPQGYVIDKEEEVVVGTTEHVHTDTDRKGDPLLAALKIAPVNETTHQTTTVEEKKEWRIYFHGVDGSAVSAAPTP